MQGNIVALIDNNANTVVEYKYAAWGNHKVVDANGNEITSSTHIGNLNPFRYRGYYYDVETGLYFLKSRYYDPEVGRFLNMDSIFFADNCETNGINLYAYCLNNPVNYIDPFGKFVISIGATLFMLAGGLFAIFVSPIIVDAAGDLAESIVDSVESINVSDGSDIYIDNNLIVESVESTKTAVDTDVISTIIKSATISFSIGLNLLNAKNQDPDPFRRPGQKKQGRERKTKARKNPDWVQRNGKRGGPKPLPKHTPGKAHRKYFSYVIDLLYLL